MDQFIGLFLLGTNLFDIKIDKDHFRGLLFNLNSSVKHLTLKTISKSQISEIY